MDIGLIAEEVSADLRNRDPGRSTRITIAPDAVAVGNPERLQAAVAGLLGAAWHVSRDDEPSNIEFGVTDRGGRVVCFARCRGSATRPAESENSPVPSDGNGAQPTPDLGLSLVRYALGGPDARIWTENDEDAGPAFFFALPKRTSPKPAPRSACRRFSTPSSTASSPSTERATSKASMRPPARSSATPPTR